MTYIRANIDCPDEKEIGALPGDLLDKVRHLAYPILDNLSLFMTPNNIEYLIEEERIEILPLMMMRGRSFNNRVIIIDEAQNITPKAMKTILTRCGETSKMIIIGDPDQCDIHPFSNGLRDLEWRMAKTIEKHEKNDIEMPISMNIIHFNRNDIVRSALTKFVIDMYTDN